MVWGGGGGGGIGEKGDMSGKGGGRSRAAGGGRVSLRGLGFPARYLLDSVLPARLSSGVTLP